MTTPWTITPIWKGETVAILAAGPSMSQELADSVRQYRCIALNHTIRIAPWADMMVALDPGPTHCADVPDFAGIRICGSEDPDTDARYIGTKYERVAIGPGHIVDIRNNGLAAIRIAAELGAAKILLLGFDPSKRGYWSGDFTPEQERVIPATGEPYVGLTAGLESIIAELRAQGIDVEYVTAIE